MRENIIIINERSSSVWNQMEVTVYVIWEPCTRNVSSIPREIEPMLCEVQVSTTSLC